MDNRPYQENNGFPNGIPSNNGFSNNRNMGSGNQFQGGMPNQQVPNNAPQGGPPNRPQGQPGRPGQPVMQNRVPQQGQPGRPVQQGMVPRGVQQAPRMQGGQPGARPQNALPGDMSQTGRVPQNVINEIVQTGRIPTELIATIASGQEQQPHRQARANMSSPAVAGARPNGVIGQGAGNSQELDAMVAAKNSNRQGQARQMPARPARPVALGQAARPGQTRVPGAQAALGHTAEINPAADPRLIMPVGPQRPMRMKKKSNVPLIAVLVVLALACIGFATKDKWYDSAKAKFQSSVQDNQKDGQGNDSASNEPVIDAGPAYVTIYYKKLWETDGVLIHYQAGASSDWTQSPGVPMEKSNEVPGFDYKYTIEIKKGETAKVCFNDGNPKENLVVWDSNANVNYSIPEGTYCLDKKVLYAKESTLEITEGTCTVYYYGYREPNVHYQIGAELWTESPGVPMEKYNDTGLLGKAFEYIARIPILPDGTVTMCFNDGSDHWDNNKGYNYKFFEGTYLFDQEGYTRFQRFAAHTTDAINADPTAKPAVKTAAGGAAKAAATAKAATAK